MRWRTACFGPWVARDNGELDRGSNTGAQEWTEQLLREMAFHLRMLQRRGVYPAFSQRLPLLYGVCHVGG